VKVAIIGLDGLPFDFVSSIAHEEGLRNFREILTHGSSGILRSTIPPVSPVAWASISTGLNPGKHGVFGFTDRLHRPYSSRNLMGLALWDLLALAGKKSICLNVPFTYPPYPIRGLMVSGPPCPRDRPSSYPPDLAEELEEAGYRVDIDLPGEEFTGLREEDFLKDARAVTKARAEALLSLADGHEWDLFYAVFTTLDRVQHVFFGRALRESPFYDGRGRKALLAYYRALDDRLGEILRELGNDTLFFFVSDHGFEPLYRYVGLQNLVLDFLTRKRLYTSLYRRALYLMGRLGLQGRIKAVLDKLGLTSAVSRRAGGGFECGPGHIYSNRPEDELLRLIEFLKGVKDEGGRVFERIYRREEIYWGPKLRMAPDLILVPRAGYEIRGLLPDKFEDVRPVKGMIYKTGTHASHEALKGFLALYGPGVKEGSWVNACVYDIAPTVLHVLGLPVLSNMDGEVLVRAFKENSDVAKRPVRTVRLGVREELALRVRRLRGKMRERKAGR